MPKRCSTWVWGAGKSDGADYIMFPSLNRALTQFKVGLLRPSHTQVEQRICQTGLPRLPEPPFQRAVPTTPADRMGADVDCFPIHTAFPVMQAGRHPHHHFRGLLRLHSRYGPLDCSTAPGGPFHEASTRSVSPPNPPAATGANHQP